ncbi:MAG: cytochrome C oxidase subunit IV family protein [Bacteroidetes bacterium]|nr:cytochrome C oxidase subunit IV family protein [Bacteroidota bacterium]
MSHAEHHVSSIKMLSIVFGGLVFLTVTTVLTAQIDLGAFNVPLAMTIAVIKASLVIVIFMALKWDNKVNAVIFGLGLLFVAVFISFVLFDTLYRGDMSSTTKGTVQDEVIRNEALQSREPDPSSLQPVHTP